MTDVSAHPLVQSVVNQVYSDPTVAPQNAASVAAGILNGVAQYEPAALTLTRSSPITAGWVGLGIGVLSAIIEAFFPHPGLTPPPSPPAPNSVAETASLTQ